MKAPSTVFDFVRRRPTPVPPDPVQKPAALPPVDEEFVEKTAAGVLSGSSSIQVALDRVAAHHRRIGAEFGYEERHRLTGQLARVTVRREQFEGRMKELTQRFRRLSRYVEPAGFSRAGVLKKPWTPAVWSKLVFLILGVVAALAGGIVTISSFLLAQPAWDSPIKAFTIAVSFVVLPALGVALFYKALLDKSPNAARRLRTCLATGLTLSFVLAAGAFAYLFSESLNPNSGIDLTALLEGSIPVSDEGEVGLQRWAPVLLTFLLMLLDFQATAYVKCYLTDLFVEHGWPKIRSLQETPEWVKENAERKGLDDELAKIREEEAVLKATLQNFDVQLDARSQRLADVAGASLAAKLEAISRLRAEFPHLYQKPTHGGAKS